MYEKIWRDDDVGATHESRTGRIFKGTDLETLRAVDDVFQRYGVPHTIAIIAKGFNDRRDLISLIRERKMVCQLHCWTHEDLTVDAVARDDLERAVDMLEHTVGLPTMLFPPWNRSSPEVEEAAAELGLTVSTRKASLEQYLRFNGRIGETVINFHHWHIPDVALLDPALRVYCKGER